jgi:hypothetical protein
MSQICGYLGSSAQCGRCAHTIKRIQQIGERPHLKGAAGGRWRRKPITFIEEQSNAYDMSLVEALRLKASNAAPSSSTSPGHSRRGIVIQIEAAEAQKAVAEAQRLRPFL